LQYKSFSETDQKHQKHLTTGSHHHSLTLCTDTYAAVRHWCNIYSTYARASFSDFWHVFVDVW